MRDYLLNPLPQTNSRQHELDILSRQIHLDQKSAKALSALITSENMRDDLPQVDRLLTSIRLQLVDTLNTIIRRKAGLMSGASLTFITALTELITTIKTNADSLANASDADIETSQEREQEQEQTFKAFFKLVKDFLMDETSFDKRTWHITCNIVINHLEWLDSHLPSYDDIPPPNYDQATLPAYNEDTGNTAPAVEPSICAPGC